MMRWVDVQLRSSALSASVDTFVQWWLDELLGLIPTRLKKLFGRERGTLVLDVLEHHMLIGAFSEHRFRSLGSIAIADLNGDKGFANGFDAGNISKRVVVRLPADKIFRKSIELPLAAKSKLRTILGHELERHAPLAANQVAYDYRILTQKPASNAVVVELTVVRKQLLDHAINLARHLNLQLVGFGVIEDGDVRRSYRFVADVPSAYKRGSSGKIERPLMAFTAVLFAAFLWACWWQQHRDAQEVAALTGRLRPQALAATDLRKQVEVTAERLQFLARERQRPLFVDVLREVTSVLPDDTWLDNLTVDGAAVRIQGYAPSAARLIELFDKSPLLTNAHFSAPVTKGPQNGLEHFDLSMAVRMGSQP